MRTRDYGPVPAAATAWTGRGRPAQSGGVGTSRSVAGGLNCWSLGEESIGSGRYHRRPCGGGDRYAALGRAVMRILVLAGVPEYRHARSNHVYSYHQKIALLVLRRYVDSSYRRFCEDLPSYGGFLRALGMSWVPHFTTLCKFSSSVDLTHLDMVAGVLCGLCPHEDTIAVDSTCLSNFDRSSHYERRLKDFGVRPPRPFSKLSLSVGTESLMIVAYVGSAKGNCGDSPHASVMVATMAEHGRRPCFIVADKAYDGEPLRKAIHYELGADDAIPVRAIQSNSSKNLGFFRKKAAVFVGAMCSRATLAYRQRAMVETVNSMVKRNFGARILSRKDSTRSVETVLFVICHNIRRGCQTGIINLATL